MCVFALVKLTSEMTEKWRILQNEADVLTASAQEKDKLVGDKLCVKHNIVCCWADCCRGVG